VSWPLAAYALLLTVLAVWVGLGRVGLHPLLTWRQIRRERREVRTLIAEQLPEEDRRRYIVVAPTAEQGRRRRDDALETVSAQEEPAIWSVIHDKRHAEGMRITLKDTILIENLPAVDLELLTAMGRNATLSGPEAYAKWTAALKEAQR